jgi:hypothetical protein
MSNVFYEIMNELDQYIIVDTRSPSGLRNFGPKPLVNPHGPHYQMHPDLSRPGGPGVYYAVAGIALVAAPVVGAAWVTEAYRIAVVEQAPAEQESFWWRVWSSGLTGGSVTQYY